MVSLEAQGERQTMKIIRSVGLCAAILAVFLFVSPSAQATSGNVNFFVGQKSMDDSDYWDPTDDQTEFGLIFDMSERRWPLSLEMGFMMSSDDSSDGGVFRDATTSELFMGVKKIWAIRNFPLKPFVSGGLAYVSAEDEFENAFYSLEADDSALGFYLSAGAYATLSRHLNLGFLFRISKAELDLIDDDVDAGGEHFGLFIGYHF